MLNTLLSVFLIFSSASLTETPLPNERVDARIIFAPDSAEISHLYAKVFIGLGRTVILENAKLEIKSCTSSQSTEEYSLSLADKRVQAVKRHFALHGITDNNIIEHSYGENCITNYRYEPTNNFITLRVIR